MENHMNHKHEEMHHYRKLLIMTVLSFIAMYILMYAMVDRFENVIPNVNQFFMAGLMAMPMVIIELLVMGAMYKNKKANLAIISASTIALVACFFAIRVQATVGDKEFLKSMIPHHAAAVLMVKEATLTDPEIQELAKNIITSQQAEIRQMKDKIKELENEKPQ
jgi:uncharacterized protein (DUF305 family)